MKHGTLNKNGWGIVIVVVILAIFLICLKAFNKKQKILELRNRLCRYQSRHGRANKHLKKLQVIREKLQKTYHYLYWFLTLNLIFLVFVAAPLFFGPLVGVSYLTYFGYYSVITSIIGLFFKNNQGLLTKDGAIGSRLRELVYGQFIDIDQRINWWETELRVLDKSIVQTRNELNILQ